MVPQKAALKYREEKKVTHNELAHTNKHMITLDTHTDTYVANIQAGKGKRERANREEEDEEEEIQTINTHKQKKWEKRLNENYFKLFRKKRGEEKEKQAKQDTGKRKRNTKNRSKCHPPRS